MADASLRAQAAALTAEILAEYYRDSGGLLDLLPRGPVADAAPPTLPTRQQLRRAFMKRIKSEAPRFDPWQVTRARLDRALNGHDR